MAGVVFAGLRLRTRNSLLDYVARPAVRLYDYSFMRVTCRVRLSRVCNLVLVESDVNLMLVSLTWPVSITSFMIIVTVMTARMTVLIRGLVLARCRRKLKLKVVARKSVRATGRQRWIIELFVRGLVKTWF